MGRLYPGATTQQSMVEKSLTSTSSPTLQLEDVLEAAADSLIHLGLSTEEELEQPGSLAFGCLAKLRACGVEHR